MSNKNKGKYGEDIAVKYLINNGYKIIERNYHFSRYGEIDIIALDKKILCFIEVKARSNNKFGAPLESVTHTKLAKIYKCALAYLAKNAAEFKSFRIDAISVDLSNVDSIDNPQIVHIKNIEF